MPLTQQELVCNGKTEISLPKDIKFPDGFDLCYNEKHWANEITIFSLIDKVILPFMKKIKAENNLAEDCKTLLIFDVFRGQTTVAFTEYLAKKNCIAVFVPLNMTDIFQPSDVSVNKNIKSMTRNYYSEQVDKALNNGTAPTDVNVKQPIYYQATSREMDN